jgi:hypothetical protein
MFMAPLASATYNAFKENRFQEFSDKSILNIKSKIDNIFRNIF